MMPSLRNLLGLCKLKVVALILLTAVVGMFLSVPAPYVPDTMLMITASIGISMASASAAVFNHIVDEQIDKVFIFYQYLCSVFRRECFFLEVSDHHSNHNNVSWIICQCFYIT
jgi:hypothetical protein